MWVPFFTESYVVDWTEDDGSSDEDEFKPASSADGSPQVTEEEEEYSSASDIGEAELTLSSSTYRARDGSVWSKNPLPTGRLLKKNIFNPPCNKIPGTENVTDAYGAFRLFVCDKMLEKIVYYTNIYGVSHFEETWFDCDIVEIEALIGLLLFFGRRKQNIFSTDEIWDDVYGVNLARAVMSQVRFETLLSCLRFDDKVTRSERRESDVFAPFREMWEEFNRNLAKHYIPGRNLTVGEQLLPFRGRCDFLQYSPSTPERYGIKVFWITDSDNSYPLAGRPYLGRPLGRERPVNLGRNTVLELAEPFKKTGRNITCGNFFTDLALAEACLKDGLTVVGSVRTNQRFIPTPFKEKRGLPLHECEFVYNESTTVVNYQGKKNKNTVVLSSMHSKGEVKEGAPKRKPEMIRYYDATKGAVDSLDRLRQAFSTQRKTQRWPMVMFSNILDLATVAARCIFSIKYPDDHLASENGRNNFIQSISETMIEVYMVRRLTHPQMPTDLSLLIETSIRKIGESAEKNKEMARVRGFKLWSKSGIPSMGSTSHHRKRPADSQPESFDCAKRQKDTDDCEEYTDFQLGGLEVVSTYTTKRYRCSLCPKKKDNKVSNRCFKCQVYICRDHSKLICDVCLDNQLVTSDSTKLRKDTDDCKKKHRFVARECLTENLQKKVPVFFVSKGKRQKNQ